MRATCGTCGVELHDTTRRFCGGDRCLRVWMRHAEEFTWPEFVQRGSPLTEDPAPDLPAPGGWR